MRHLLAFLVTSLVLAGCSEFEDAKKLAEAGEIMEELAESNFEPLCTDPLEQFEQSIEEDEQGSPRFTATHQQQAKQIFEQCLKAFNEEIALAKEEFGDLNDIPNCKNALRETEAQYPALESAIAEFASLENNSSEELALQFSFTSAQVYTIGAMPMILRTAACPMEKAGFDMEGLDKKEPGEKG